MMNEVMEKNVSGLTNTNSNENLIHFHPSLQERILQNIYINDSAI